MKKILKTSFFVFSFLALFYSNVFAFLEFKQEKDISSDTKHLRGITFKPDGSRMYVTTDKNLDTAIEGTVIEYSLSTAFDITSITGWSLVGNFERFITNGKGYSNDIYLSIGYVPIDEMKFVFDVNNFNTTSLSLTNKVNGFDITVGSNYTLMSEIPDYGANIEVSNKF